MKKFYNLGAWSGSALFAIPLHLSDTISALYSQTVPFYDNYGNHYPAKGDMEMVSVIKDNCTVKEVQCTRTITNSGYLLSYLPCQFFFVLSISPRV